MHALLLATILMPLAGSLLVRGDAVRARRSALVTGLFVLGMAGVLCFRYTPEASGFAAVELDWFAGAPVDIRFSLALDGLSVWLVGLTALLSVVAVLVSWEAIQDNAARYYRLLLVLEAGMLGAFCARDIVLFYVCFEFTLIPLFFLIGIWGSEERQHAAVKFFLYTLAGSVLTFLGLLAIVLWASPPGRWTFSIPELTARLMVEPLPPGVQAWIFLALFAGFAIKVPLFPLHTWLPLAHVQAPTAGSVILAGLLLKIGTYGFLRFSVPMLPEATVACMPWVLGLAVGGILYGALVALAQSDIKRLIAYSSVSHLGFCMLGIFSLTAPGVQGGALQMINHGLSTGGLFAVVGMLYERYHTRQVKDLAGLARRLPVLAFFTLVLVLSSIGLPGLNGFAGEFLLLLGMFQRAFVSGSLWLQVLAVSAVFGVVLGAWYMLTLVQQVFFGPLREPAHDHGPPVRDLSVREVAALCPLVVFIVWIGVAPGFFLDRMGPTLEYLTAPATQAAAKNPGRFLSHATNPSEESLVIAGGGSSSSPGVATAGLIESPD